MRCECSSEHGPHMNYRPRSQRSTTHRAHTIGNAPNPYKTEAWTNKTMYLPAGQVACWEVTRVLRLYTCRTMSMVPIKTRDVSTCYDTSRSRFVCKSSPAHKLTTVHAMASAAAVLSGLSCLFRHFVPKSWMCTWTQGLS